MTTDLITRLGKIVGSRFVSGAAEERYLYSMDPGTMPAAAPDAVVMPANTDEVQQVVLLANELKVPIVPMGAGLVLSGLTRALRGGIIVDMKRMNHIIEVNPQSRYAVVESGAAQGMLKSYLKKHHPQLKHSMPDAPPIATLGGNVCIHGSGHLSVLGGSHSDMLTGMEIVLPSGEIIRTGSCSVSGQWFARSPLPDLSGLFVGWAGTTGIVTKLGIKLFPSYKHNDVLIFVAEDADLMPEIISRLTSTQVAEDMTPWMSPKPSWAKGFLHINIAYGAHTKKELTFKRNLLQESVREYMDRKIAGFLPLPPPQKGRFLEIPSPDLARFADLRKGGGFEYVGAMMAIEHFPQAYRAGLEIAEKYNVSYSLGARIIGAGHCMMFFFAYAFNRADAEDVKRASDALEATNTAALEIGGIPWKAEEPAQKQIIEKMDPGTFSLMNRIRATLDPNGIMNPGNWEI
ncbi:MAG: FAD-binding oxidoreductase [Desulfobacteraceae bacterium]|jgi:FAD/FMN-containing dehydrogenase|nr:FAD-binding oxidoreductase [Desulfobacteraceae bacterium]